MSDDLVKRLEAQRQNWYDGPTQDFHQVQDPLCAEAAARIRLLEQQLKTAREEERERCAKTVEANAAIVDHPSVYIGGPSQTAKRVTKGFAAAIRSLGEKDGQK